MSYEGSVVLNYKLTKKLGEGGFGAVYLAEQVELGRRAAIKILHHQFASQPAVVERFFREAAAVCAIGHRTIVAIENYGRLPTGEPFYLMEFFAGGSLTQITGERWLTSEQLVAILDPIADALGAAHAKGIIHRDLKPDNIMVRIADDKVVDVRLLDFGIAKLLDGNESKSMTGSAMGTPSYMPPEQALDAKNVDVRADVYAFGATVYAAVSGRPPFDGSSVAAILLAAQQQTAALLPSVRADVTPELDAAIRRCLAKQREHRPPAIADAWQAIRAELVRARLSSTPAAPSAHPNHHVQTPPAMHVVTPPTAVPPQITPSAPDPAAVKAIDLAPATTPEVPRRSKLPLILGVVGGAGVVAAVVVVVISKGDGSPATAQPSGADAATAHTVIRDAAPVAPPPDVADTLPALDADEVIGLVTRDARARLAECGAKSNARTTPVRYRFDISPDGTISWIRIDGPSTTVAECVRSALDKAKVGIRPSHSGGEFSTTIDMPVDPVAAKPDPRPKTPDPKPRPDPCTEATLVGAGDAASTAIEVTMVMKKLEGCRGKLDAATFQRVQQALVKRRLQLE